MMSNHPRVYTTVAFVAGILLTLGFKDFYPDLERRFRRRRKALGRNAALPALHTEEKVELTDQTDSNVHKGAPSLESRNVKSDSSTIPEGIESCIGNTPLFKIKSLSDETGCEILAKAEVCWQGTQEMCTNVRTSNIQLSSFSTEVGEALRTG